MSVPLQLLENKEDTFIASLAEKLAPLGYSIAPTFFTPIIPPTAAEAAAEAAAAAAAALEDATAQHEDATAWLAEAMGGPGEAGAQIRAKEAEEKLTAAEKRVEDLATGGAAAAAAAAVSEKMLGQYDVVFWKPRKTMTVSKRLVFTWHVWTERVHATSTTSQRKGVVKLLTLCRNLQLRLLGPLPCVWMGRCSEGMGLGDRWLGLSSVMYYSVYCDACTAQHHVANDG
jgi:hypothetical protein